LHPGDEVAVMPRDGTKPVDLLSVPAVSHVGELFVQTNGRLYAVLDGRSLDRDGTYIVPATKEYFSAIAKRT